MADKLDDLTEEIRDHCLAIALAEASALDHAILVGHALAKAKALVPGSWTDWIAVNLSLSHPTLTIYMRIAYYEAAVRAAGCATIEEARTYLLGFPDLPRGRLAAAVDADLIERVRAREITARQAAEVAGVSRSVIYNRVNGKVGKTSKNDHRAQARRRARDKAARAALREKEQARRAKKVGGGAAELYSLLRRASQAADQACSDTDNRQLKALFTTAHRTIGRAELAVNEAIGIAYGE